MKILSAILSLILMPWLVLYDWLTGQNKTNSGHTAGLCQGFLLLAALIVGAMELLSLLAGYLLYLAYYNV